MRLLFVLLLYGVDVVENSSPDIDWNEQFGSSGLR